MVMSILWFVNIENCGTFLLSVTVGATKYVITPLSRQLLRCSPATLPDCVFQLPTHNVWTRGLQSPWPGYYIFVAHTIASKSYIDMFFRQTEIKQM